MKPLLFVVGLCCLISCKPNETKMDKYYGIFRARNYPDTIYSSLARYIVRHHPDEKKKQEARTWLIEQQHKRDDTVIIRKAFYLIEVIQLEERCNRISKHYLATRLTRNEDTLKRAILILGKSLRTQNYDQCTVSKKLHTAVFLYRNMKDFDNKRYFSMAHMYNGNPVMVDVPINL